MNRYRPITAIVVICVLPLLCVANAWAEPYLINHRQNAACVNSSGQFIVNDCDSGLVNFKLVKFDITTASTPTSTSTILSTTSSNSTTTAISSTTNLSTTTFLAGSTSSSVSTTTSLASSTSSVNSTTTEASSSSTSSTTSVTEPTFQAGCYIDTVACDTMSFDTCFKTHPSVNSVNFSVGYNARRSRCVLPPRHDYLTYDPSEYSATWSGGCRGSGSSCSIKITRGIGRATATVTVRKKSDGKIVFGPKTINAIWEDGR